MARSSDVTIAEKRRFIGAVRKALRELDYEQFESLVYWQGANEHSREYFENYTKHLLGHLANRPRLKITLLAKSETPLNSFPGLTLKFTHLLSVGMGYPVGIKDGRLYISWPRRHSPPAQLDAETERRIQVVLQAARERASSQ